MTNYIFVGVQDYSTGGNRFLVLKSGQEPNKELTGHGVFLVVYEMEMVLVL